MSQSLPLGWLALLLILAVVAAVTYWRAPAGGVRVAQAMMFTSNVPEPGTMLLFVVAMSYVPGLVPALVGGACMGLLRPALGALARVGAAALLCGLAAGAFGAGVLNLRATSLPPMLGLGAVSGAILEGAWLWCERRRRKPAPAVS